jgi:class 3 adenylate cyclase
LRNSSTEVDCDRVLATVLITDIVDSTKRVAEIGDRHWRALLDRHDAATRYQVKRFGGRGVRNRGDGFLAIFDSPARAVRCAAAIAETIAPLGISVRSGIHVGKTHLKRDGTMNPIEPQDFMKGQRPESSRSRSAERTTSPVGRCVSIRILSRL